MANQAFSGAATGAAAGSAAGPYGAAIGAGLGLVGGLLADKSERKKLKARAQALEAQAQRRLAKGQQEADVSVYNGKLNQTSQFASLLSKGVSRNDSIVNISLDEIAVRASFEAGLALEQAQYDAGQIRADAGAMNQDAGNSTASYINGANTLLSIYGSYNSADMASKAANDRATASRATNNYRRPY